jgi:thymidylate kinase
MNRGRLIVIEGLDGVGKTSASRLVGKRLDAHWATTPSVELRGGDGRIRDRYRTGDGLTLYYASCVIDAATEFESVLANGRDVVCDRYWLSTLSGAAARGSHVPLRALEPLVVPADVTVLLTGDERMRASRVLARGDVTNEDRASLDPIWASRALKIMRTGLRRNVSGRGVELNVRDRSVDLVATAVVAFVDAFAPRQAPRAPAGRTSNPIVPESNADAVKLSRPGGRSVKQLTKDLDLTETALRHWVTRADADAGNGPPRNAPSSKSSAIG